MMELAWVEDHYNIRLLRKLAYLKESPRKESRLIKCPLCAKNSNALTGGRIGLHWRGSVGHDPCQASYRRPSELDNPWDAVMWLGYYGYILLRDRSVKVQAIPSERSGYGGRWISLEDAKEIEKARKTFRA